VVLECSALGELHPMTKEQTDEIDQKWFWKLEQEAGNTS
jgi:hypothetical protein